MPVITKKRGVTRKALRVGVKIHIIKKLLFIISIFGILFMSTASNSIDKV